MKHTHMQTVHLNSVELETMLCHFLSTMLCPQNIHTTVHYFA